MIQFDSRTKQCTEEHRMTDTLTRLARSPRSDDPSLAWAASGDGRWLASRADPAAVVAVSAPTAPPTRWSETGAPVLTVRALRAR
jgi:hypothetical protein